MLTLPERSHSLQRRLRWLLIGCGLLIFFWMGLEDRHVWPVAMIGTGTSFLLTVFWFTRRFGGQVFYGVRVLLVLGLLGGIAGLGGSITTALLMLFKNARHAHLFPDFPFGLMASILALAPVWALIGGLVGVGLGLLVLARQHEPQHNSNTNT